MSPGAELNEPRRGPTPVPPLSQMDSSQALSVIALELDRLRSLIEEERGRAPNLVPYEFELAAGAAETIAVDYDPDRWVIWFRANAGAILRVFPGGDVPAFPNAPHPRPGAFEIITGQRMIVSNRNRIMTFVNIGVGQEAAHIFAVVVGGGAEFDVFP